MDGDWMQLVKKHMQYRIRAFHIYWEIIVKWNNIDILQKMDHSKLLIVDGIIIKRFWVQAQVQVSQVIVSQVIVIKIN